MTLRRTEADAAGRRRRPSTAGRSHRRVATAPVAGALAVLALVGCLSAPSSRASAAQSLDAATKRAIELQGRLDDLQSEQAAIQLRLADTAARLRTQQEALAQAQAEADAAQAALASRSVAMYKSSEVDALALLVGAVDFGDLVTRASLIDRMLATDSALLQAAEDSATRAREEAEVLERVKRENETLRDVQRGRVAAAKEALAEQKRIVATLTAAQQKALAARKTSGSASRQKWSSSSSSGSVPKVPVVVSPYSYTFLAADYAPKRFRITGESFSGLASWYGKAVDGNKTASGRRFNYQDFTCAHRSLPFGTWLAVSRGNKHVIVMVTDRGPFIAGRVLDLSEAAAAELGLKSMGVGSVTAQIVVPD